LTMNLMKRKYKKYFSYVKRVPMFYRLL